MSDMPKFLQIYSEGSEGTSRDEDPGGHGVERQQKVRGLEGELVAALLQLGRRWQGIKNLCYDS